MVKLLLFSLLPISMCTLIQAQVPAHSAAHGVPGVSIPVGAIRWDTWIGDLGSPNDKGGVYNEMALASDVRWHDRIPFYGKVLPDGSVHARFTNQEVMDREIAYAKGALDYWAFWDTPAWSTDAAYGAALRLYLSSKNRKDINFCIMLNNRPWYDHLEGYLAYFREISYQKIDGARPLVFIFTGTDAPPSGEKKNSITSGIAALRKRSEAQATGNPYIVIMNFKPERASLWCDVVGADAVSTYANGGGKGRGGPYRELAATAEKVWNPYFAGGKPVVLNCMAGWDQRPRTVACDHPTWKEIRDKGPAWYQKAEPREIAEHIAAAVRKCRDNPEKCKAVICYAWNEFTEGGWLCPVLGDGDARLRAIEQLRREEGW